METLNLYEAQSINKGKNLFYMLNKVAHSVAHEAENVTNFLRGNFSFIYLGCPIEHAMKEKVHFSELIKKILTSYKYGRKATLI